MSCLVNRSLLSCYITLKDAWMLFDKVTGNRRLTAIWPSKLAENRNLVVILFALSIATPIKNVFISEQTCKTD